jgi:hypothetical protein
MRRQDERRQNGLEVRQGRDILTEATQLLSQMSFWSNRGAYAEGRYVAISVDPRWNEDRQTIQVTLTCYAFGHQQVDWQGLPIIAQPAATRHPYGITHLDARGQGRMARLPPDDYRLFVLEHYGQGEEPMPFDADLTSGHLAAASEQPEGSFDLQLYESPDGSVRATVRQTLDETTIVAFETREADLAGAVVYFAFVLASGDIWHSASVQFSPVEEEPGLLEARWEAEIEFTEPCTFEFGVIPKAHDRRP